MERVLQFLMSNRNLFGCAAASVMLALYLLGVLGSYWFGLTCLAYAIGFLATPAPAAEHLPEGTSTKESLEWLRNKVLPCLPAESGKVLAQTLDIADELMPRLKEMDAAGAIQPENRALLKRTITRYLPDAVESYLKLPALYASSFKAAGGKTANQLLLEQLTLLHDHVAEIRDNVLSTEVDALLANSRFLQQKFSKSFELG